MTDFNRTREAVAAYDTQKPRLDALMFDSLTEDAVWAAVAAEKAEADKVREAFFEDTQHVNSRDHAKLIGPDDPWIRRLIRSV